MVQLLQVLEVREKTILYSSNFCLVMAFHYCILADFTLPDDSIVTFQSGSSSIRDSEQCRQIELLNDEIPEEIETFQVLIEATDGDRNVVQIRSNASSTTVIIIEDTNDGKS